MSNIINTINSLPGLLSIKPASAMEISKAEKELCLIFANDYKIYLETYGAILANGFELTGISKAPHRNVIKVTQQGWQLNKKISKEMYVIEDTRIDGILIWQDSKGTVYKSFPNKSPVKIFSSLNDYIDSKCKKK